MFGNVFDCIWSVAMAQSQRQDALWEGKDSPFTKHTWLKKSWFQIGPLWPKQWAGQLPGISLEDSHLPLSHGQVRESKCLSFSVSISLSCLFPLPSPRGCFCLFFLLGSELALRLYPDWFRWQLKERLTVLEWQLQQSQTDWKSLTWPTSLQKFPWPRFPLLFFLFIVPFPLPPAKIGLCPFMSELFPNDLGADWGYFLGVMLDWKQCATHRVWIWSTCWLLTLILIFAFLILLMYRPCRCWRRAGSKMPLA